ncbi:helix-turn-helix transcriptional regulator [Hymenobacter chitinivorans]|uniref:DNA-binding NarL/FixJ family response regulator n=1 Tax=Hymenobacter chitinivorans DSM 11115 TaxID=1121954 RepID=A0A2M9AS80_9BACT|nr:LuxR C-terminal-related transcriptional regulator [Hymenobacter chitinivorans]PJJ48546.1 DNA-binding NarL/FixJ family response regulator [Hymenobacter chitinivorans DSM 11115]
MSSNFGAALVAAPATLHRQGLLALLREACPGLTICLVSDTDLLLNFLQHRSYTLLVLDEALTTRPLLVLLERLYAVRSTQHVLCFSQAGSSALPPLLYPRPWTILPHAAAPHEVSGAIEQLLAHTPPRAWALKPSLPAAAAGPPTPFSRRELEVLRLVVADYCNQDIANELCLSVRTVESHRRALLQKAGARTLVGLVVQAVKQGWVTTTEVSL